MAGKNRSKTLARSIIVGGTVLAGLGIWTVISHAPSSSASNLPASTSADVPNINPNFSAGDTFLPQTNNQPGIASGQSQYPVQSAPNQYPRLRTRGS